MDEFDIQLPRITLKMHLPNPIPYPNMDSLTNFSNLTK